MADAIYWQLLETVQSLIQGLTFSVESGDTCSAPVDAAIVIRKKPFDDEDDKNDRSESTPGILISPIGVQTDPSKGTNVRDDPDYVIMVQVINRDSTFKDENLHTYLKWQQQIRKRFINQVLTDVQGAEGCVNIGDVPSQNPCSFKHFPKSKYFVANIELRFSVRETRGITT